MRPTALTRVAPCPLLSVAVHAFLPERLTALLQSTSREDFKPVGPQRVETYITARASQGAGVPAENDAWNVLLMRRGRVGDGLRGLLVGHQYFPRCVDGVTGKGVCQIAACGFHTASICHHTF